MDKLLPNAPDTLEFDAKAFYRNVFQIALPIALQGLLTQLVEASDTLMLGVLSQSALSAISLATQVHFVLNMIFVSVNIVVSTMAAQYWGRKDYETVDKVLAFALRLTLGAGVLFFAGAFFAPDFLMRLYTDDPELVALGVQYLRIASFSYVFIGVSQPFLSIMKTTGRVAKSSLFSSTAVVLNLVFNALLIYGLFGLPKLEIRGAALATVLSRGAEMLLCAQESARAKRGRFRLRLFLTDDRPVRTQFLRLLPAIMGNMAVWSLGQTVFSMIIGHLGNDAVAANSLANIVRRLIQCLCNGIGNGSAVIVGHELGADRLERAKLYSRKLLLLSVGLGVISGLILLALIPVIVSVAGRTLTPQAQQYLRYMLCMCSVYVVAKAATMVFIHGCFYAGGDMRFGLICDAINLWGFILPIGFVLAFVVHAPVMAVYCFLNLDEIVKVPAEIIHYRKYKWLRNITHSRA